MAYSSPDEPIAPASRRSFLRGLGAGAAAVSAIVTGVSFADSADSGRPLGEASYVLPAVDGTGSGLLVDLQITVRDGAGKVFVDVGDSTVRGDLQGALRTAVALAEGLAPVTLDDRNVLAALTPRGPPVLELNGRSWGAGLCATLVAALRDEGLPSDVLATGTVDESGALGPVESIPAKAAAARADGVKRLLVPDGQGRPVDDIDVVPVARIGDLVSRLLGE